MNITSLGSRKSKKQLLAVLFCVVLVLAFPFLCKREENYMTIANKILIYMLFATGLNITNGYIGLFSLGTAGFMCIGAYTSAILSTQLQLNYFLVLLCSSLFAGLIGALLAIPTGKFEGFFFSMTTLGFSEIVRLTALNWASLTGGSNGIHSIPRAAIFGHTLQNSTEYFYYHAVILAITLFCVYRIIRSRVGRAWMSIRENQEAAKSLGVSTLRYKSLNFFVMGFVLGLGGCLIAYYYRYISPELFQIDNGHEVLAMVILGGMGNLAGPLIGALIIELCMEIFRSVAAYRMLAYAVVVILMMWIRPQGILGAAGSSLTGESVFSKLIAQTRRKKRMRQL